METDFLVIGSGIAGLSFALKASAAANVAIITKKGAFNSNTADAQGGIAVPSSKADAERHIADTLAAGRGICRREAVALMVGNAERRVSELVDCGVKFEKEHGSLKRSLEAGHSAPRIIYNADATGKAIEHKLVVIAREKPKIEMMENSFLVDLMIRKGRCTGAKILRNGMLEPIFSKSTILATGGLGQVYEKTTNPEVATGDGYAAAARAGAALENMEFVQFHPTKLDFPSSHPFLISEVLRGEGGMLVNAQNEPFMQKYDKAGELAPRDVVARAIYLESLKGKVYLDMTHRRREFLKKRFPTIYAKCLGYDIDLAEDLVPVTAAAHYMCGGVKTDLRGRTSIRNLYAIGEVACTGVHGANRLASNSLLEGLVFAHEAFLDAAGRVSKLRIEKNQIPTLSISEKTINPENRFRIRKIMWEKVGLVRDARRLREAVLGLRKILARSRSELRTGASAGILEQNNMARTSLLVASAALARKHSLGCHFVK